MASKKELQKLVVFSSAYVKELIDNIIANHSTVQHKTSSAILETYLLDAMLPQNEIGKDLYVQLYMGTPVKDVLEGIFSNSGAGVYFKPRWTPDSIYPFIIYAKKIMSLNHFRHHRNEKYNTDETAYLVSQLTTILHLIEEYAEEHPDSTLERTTYNFRDMIRLTDQNLEEIRLISYIQIIQDNWEILKDNQYTYRALMSIMKTEYSWNTTPEEIYELGELIKTHSPYWD